jgi:hypothetical protein
VVIFSAYYYLHSADIYVQQRTVKCHKKVLSMKEIVVESACLLYFELCMCLLFAIFQCVLCMFRIYGYCTLPVRSSNIILFS